MDAVFPPERSLDNIHPRLDYFCYRNADRLWSIIPSRIDFHDLTYVVDGTATYFVNGESVSVGKGDLLYIPPGALREAMLTQEEKYEAYPMNFFLFDMEGQEFDRLPFEMVTHIGVQPELIAMYKALSTAWLLQDKGYRLMVRAYVELIISKLLDFAVYKNPVTVADLRIRQVIEYITAHYDQSIALKELAELVHLSPSYLSVLFHKSMGMQLSRYINMIRINHAETMLMSNMCNVTEAAESCGFCDVYYFSRVFSDMKGYTPHEIIGKRGGV